MQVGQCGVVGCLQSGLFAGLWREVRAFHHHSDDHDHSVRENFLLGEDRQREGGAYEAL